MHYFTSNYTGCARAECSYRWKWRWCVCSAQLRDPAPIRWRRIRARSTSAPASPASPAHKSTNAASAPSQRQHSTDTSPYLTVHDVGQVQRLFDDGHEVVSHDFRHEDVWHGQQTVESERLDQQQLVDGLTDRSWGHTNTRHSSSLSQGAACENVWKHWKMSLKMHAKKTIVNMHA